MNRACLSMVLVSSKSMTVMVAPVSLELVVHSRMTVGIAHVLESGEPGDLKETVAAVLARSCHRCRCRHQGCNRKQRCD